MSFELAVTEHDIEINQISSDQLQVSEILLYHNTDNESFSGTIYIWTQENAVIQRFGAVLNDSFEEGNYSELSNVMYTYNLSGNGIEIPENSSFRMELDYNLYFPSDRMTFEKTFYYSNYFLVISVYPMDDIGIRTTGVNLAYNGDEDYYYVHDSDRRTLGDHLTVTFTPKEESTSSSAILIVVLIIIVVVGFIGFQIMTDSSGASDAGRGRGGRGGSSLKPIRKSDKFGKGEKIQKGSKGKTAGKTAGNSGGKLTGKTAGKSSGGELESLLESKNRLLLAIKRLDEDCEAGLLTDDIYEDLKAQYKKKAVEILKQIDEQE